MLDGPRPQLLPHKLKENRQERETQGGEQHPGVGVKDMTSALPLACGQPEIYFFNHGIKYTLFSFGETKTTPILQITQVD